MIKRESGPLARLRLYADEFSSFLHRRRLRRTPYVRVYWPDGSVNTLDPESPEVGPLLAIAEKLIDLAD